MLRKVVGSVLLSLAVFAMARSEEMKDIDSALNIARKRGQKVFLYFGAPWCRYCVTMQSMFRDPAVRSLFDSNVTVMVDITNDRTTARRYGVSAIPDYMVINPRTGAIIRQKGTMSKATFIAWFNKVK